MKKKVRTVSGKAKFVRTKTSGVTASIDKYIVDMSYHKQLLNDLMSLGTMRTTLLSTRFALERISESNHDEEVKDCIESVNRLQEHMGAFCTAAMRVASLHGMCLSNRFGQIVKSPEEYERALEKDKGEKLSEVGSEK